MIKESSDEDFEIGFQDGKRLDEGLLVSERA